MELLQRIDADLKQAMKNRDAAKVSCLRLTTNALKIKSKDLLRPLSEEEQVQTLKTLAKQRRESCELFIEAERHDLADKERAELAIIESYLPAQVDTDTINKVLDEVFAELAPAGPKDMGKVMKEAMNRFGGTADGKLVNELVRQRFGQ